MDTKETPLHRKRANGKGVRELNANSMIKENQEVTMQNIKEEANGYPLQDFGEDDLALADLLLAVMVNQLPN